MSDTKTSELALELAAAHATSPPLSADDATRVAALREQNAAFMHARDPVAFARSVRAHARQRSEPARGARALFMVAPALACVAVFVVVGRGSDEGVAPLHGDVRVKGDGPILTGALVRPAGAERIDAGSRARAGDLVQLRVDAVSPGDDVVVVSIDGRGSVTLHHPKRAGAVLGPQGLVPSSFELDDAPAYERFIAVVGQGVDVDAVLASARVTAAGDAPRDAHLLLDPSFIQRTLLVAKEHAR